MKFPVFVKPVLVVRHVKINPMGEVKTEIENAIQTLGLVSSDIYLLDKQTGEKVFTDCLHHFVKSGDRRWWWEDFRQPSFSFKHFDKPFEYIKDIVPEQDRHVWLIVEDDDEPFYPVYETKPEVIGKVIAACFAFEYYVVDKDKQWLLCENHHNRLIGIGESLKSKNIDKIL